MERAYLALDLEHAFQVNGALADWQGEVGRHAQGHSRLGFALSCAFAAPLVGRLGMESGGFRFCGWPNDPWVDRSDPRGSQRQPGGRVGPGLGVQFAVEVAAYHLETKPDRVRRPGT